MLMDHSKDILLANRFEDLRPVFTPPIYRIGPGYGNLALIVFCLCSIAVFLQHSGIDIWLERHFYDPQLGWIYRSHWLFEQVLHRDGRLSIILVGTSTFLLYFASYRVAALAAYKKGLACILLGGILSVGLIALLKHVIPIYSPWDCQVFGGSMPRLLIFDHQPLGIKAGHAFPSGHASAGFSLLGFYFFSKVYKIWNSGFILSFILITGFTFGLAQQIRGAHFMSHDFAALAVCWVINDMVFRLINPWEKIA